VLRLLDELVVAVEQAENRVDQLQLERVVAEAAALDKTIQALQQPLV
jgi:hypothetical protein